MALRKMTIPEKLAIIQKRLELSQTKLAARLGVSFVAFNNWWNAKSVPRPKAQAAIEELFLEVTGQKVISPKQLLSKKTNLATRSGQYKNIVAVMMANPDVRDQLILKLTYNSNRIEGSTLTEPDTAAILFDDAALPNKSLTEQLEVKNHQAALNYTLEHSFKKNKIDENFILKLHATLMNGIHPDAGRYRDHGVRIVGVNLPTANYLQVPRLMSEITAKAAKSARDIVGLCAKVHSNFEQVHPFADGNGRVGRLLMNAMLLQANFAPAIIQENQKQLYYTYLYKSQTGGDYSQLEDFLCDSVSAGFDVLERLDNWLASGKGNKGW